MFCFTLFASWRQSTAISSIHKLTHGLILSRNVIEALDVLKNLPESVLELLVLKNSVQQQAPLSAGNVLSVANAIRTPALATER